jgi:hypothetical protein
MNQKIYKGRIIDKEYEDNYSALFIGEDEYPFAKIWEDDLYKKQVTVRYWISEVEKTKDELKENTLAAISGAVWADYTDRYSDYTGYLWTDVELKVGGHNLLSELSSNVGKFLYMEVDY